MIPMQSETIKEVTKALIAANEAIGDIIKESDGHNYKYAKLPQLLKAVLPGLRAHGLMLSNIPQMIDGVFVLICQVTHDDNGEFIRGVYPLERDSSGGGRMSILQQNGSAITYAARYSISNMLSLPVMNEEDNDGAMVANESAPAAYASNPAPAPSHVKKTWALLYKEKDIAIRNKLIQEVCKKVGNQKVNEFTPEQCKNAEAMLDTYFNNRSEQQEL